MGVLCRAGPASNGSPPCRITDTGGGHGFWQARPSHGCPGGRFVSDCLWAGSPALIGVFVDVAVVAREIASGVDLQYARAEQGRRRADLLLEGGLWLDPREAVGRRPLT